jgi:hypothetical protein
VIYTRGKLVQENILPEFKEARAYAQYIVGDVEADFIDMDNMDDLATSDRQHIVSEDPRYTGLKQHIHEAIKKIGLDWTSLRNERGVKKALEIPVINEWLNNMTPGNMKIAKKLIGKIEQLPYSDDHTRRELYKASILAFEKLAFLGQLDELETVREESLETLIGIFKSIDDLEAAYYYEIAQGRLRVISEFTDLIDDDQKERVLQSYLFDHLWLLDASWERASGSERLEQVVKREFDDLENSLTDDERKGRIDIRFQTVAGKHVIVELKRASVKVDVFDLSSQISKYRSALMKVLNTHFPDQRNVHIEIVCVLGSHPTPLDDSPMVEATLKAQEARFVTYDQLISGAQKAYSDYLKKKEKISIVADLLKRLDESL